MRYSLVAMLLFAGLLICWSDLAQAEDKKEPPKTEKKQDKDSFLMVVPPAGGKEVKLVDWRFTLGTRQLAITEAAKPKTTGPEYLEFREENSTTYKNGIFTFVPLNSIRKINYDRDKKTVSLTALKDGGEDVTLVGSTKFTANKLTIEAEAVIEGLGNATVKFQGGIDKGLQSVVFPTPKPAEKVQGSPSLVVADDKEKTKHIVHDLQPLYLVDGQYRVVPYLMFKKTVKVDMEKFAGMKFVPSADKKIVSNDYEVTLRDGNKHTLSLLKTVEGDKKKLMTFQGFLGRVPVGYKLIMTDAIFEVRMTPEDEKK